FGEEEVSIKQEVKQEVPEQKTQATISASPKKQQVTVSVGNAELFGKLIDSVKQENHSIAGILRGCSLVEVGDSALTVSTAYKFHGDKLSEEKARKVIEKCASAIIGKSVTLQVKVGS